MLQSKTPRVATEASTLGGQDKEKGADSESTGLTGPTGLTGTPSKSVNSSKSKTRPSFKELLAKYEKEGTAQKRRSNKVKDMKSSTKHQEQSDSHPRQVDTPSNEPVIPWYGWFPYSYLPMDYSRIYMQSYYIQYHPMYPNYGLPQRPVVSSNNLVKQDIDCSKADEKGSKRDSKYLQPKWCPSGLSHAQKRKLQRMRKKETMEQQVEVEPKTSTIMKKV